MQKKLIKVHPSDNVAVALVNLKAGEVVTFEGQDIKVVSDVKAKHKIALIDLQRSTIQYGFLIHF